MSFKLQKKKSPWKILTLKQCILGDLVLFLPNFDETKKFSAGPYFSLKGPEGRELTTSAAALSCCAVLEKLTIYKKVILQNDFNTSLVLCVGQSTAQSLVNFRWSKSAKCFPLLEQHSKGQIQVTVKSSVFFCERPFGSQEQMSHSAPLSNKTHRTCNKNKFLYISAARAVYL